LTDPRFANAETRMDHDVELQAELGKTLATKTALEWEAILSEAGVPAGAVRPLSAVLDLPQLQDRDLRVDVDVPNAAVGRTSILNAGFRFAHDGPGVSGPPPLLGQHTDEILAELGMAVPAQ
jgi:crotonobetainyl-CoA:carnitine CoA-transferase CaiB-like acyl-CoA transferase